VGTGLVNGATSAKGSRQLTAQPDAASGSGRTAGEWPTSDGGAGDGTAGDWRPGELQRQAWRDRLLPPVEQVRPGLWSIPVPWPDSGLRYTLAYLLETRAGMALVDTGWPNETAWTALRDGVREAGHDLAGVGYVLVTHAHPDHLGLADRVREASGARVGMHPAEAATLRTADQPAWRERVADWLRCRGAPPNEAADITSLLAGGVARHARLARPDTEIEHGSLPLGAGTAVRAVWTPGHTPGHLCFYDERHDVLLTGDHVLPRITPHIGLTPGADGDPLGDYQASLRALARYDPAEVLPAHEHRFTGLGARVETLLRHHRTRLAEIEHVVACYPGLSTWTVAEALTWSRGWEQTRGPARQAAISETWAHLVYLRTRDRVADQGRGVDAWVPGPRGSAVD